MKVIISAASLQKICIKLAGKSIGLVPTMGALHAGHESLIKKSVSSNDITIVSIFVNSKQFGPGEDYLKYPRSIAADLKVCKAYKVDYVFVPRPKDMYAKDHSTYVDVSGLSELLCGAVRKGHFRGVTTVVAKLFNITFADNAYFGLKDFQQLKVIQKMAADLNFKTRVVPCPTVREKDGLALSSRNTYLSPAERAQALKISEALLSGLSPSAIKKRIKKDFPKYDYIEILDAGTLGKISKKTKEAVIAVAVWIGKTRLIDNITVRGKL